ncbi:neutral zinc metallopeptidase [Kribbella sp. NPDC056345]|uniref:neutral zinc metallopeptidase n=1 Tax=Kribbella sp. NPDC056345 TaxID=3345789 RepID=UPI0035D676DB
MPDEQPDGGANTPPGAGHYLPTSDSLTESDRTTPAAANRSQPIALGKARALSDPGESSLRRKARPLPVDPSAESVYSGPPPAPLPGAPITPLAGTRRTGGDRRVGWNRPSSRAGSQYTQVGPPPLPPRQYSKAVIAGLSALVLVVTASVGVACFKAISSYDSSVDSPLSRPKVRTTPAPIPTPPDPTVTVTEKPVPNLVRLQKNELYTVGKVPSVNCKTSIKPDSQSAILEYYQALVACLDKTWAPLIKKAGYKFEAPTVVLQSKKAGAGCTETSDSMYYCNSTGHSISINWQEDLKDYREDPAGAQIWMMTSVATVYGFHVQDNTEMLTASFSEEGFAKTDASKFQARRMRQLQNSCFGGIFLGANKQSLGLTGAKYDTWERGEKSSSNDPKVTRLYGSGANQWFWTSSGFTAQNPKACNTFTASPKRVS